MMSHSDPAGGAALPPQRRSLQQRYSPYAKAKNGRGTLRRLLALYAQWKGLLLVVILLTVLSTLASLAVPYLLGLAVDCFRADAVDRATLSVLLLLLAAAAAVQWIANWGRRRWMEILSQKMVNRIRQACFAKLGRLPLTYFDRHPHGDTMSRLVSDADNVSTVAAESVTYLFSSLLTVAGACVIMAVLSPLLTLTALATVPVIALCTHLISRQSRNFYRRQADELGGLSGLVQEALSNGRTIKLYHQQEEILERFDCMNRTLCATSVKAQVCAGLLSPLVNMVNYLGFALIACVGGALALRGAVRVGLVVSFLGYSRQLGRPLNSIAALFSSIQQAVAGAERLFDILDETEMPQDVPDAISPRKVRGEVAFEDVSFSYEPGKPVLEHVSFRVKAGEVIAFVGETGAGKSTLIHLLTRAYDPSAGTIRLDGVPLEQYRREELGSCFSVVPQDTVFFQGTILDNLRYARPEASREDVICAAELANIHGFIQRLPKGYDTVISGAAEEFSQGQRQLLAIARALVSQASILILDEATSCVDTTTERRIQQATMRLLKGRTCFLIAHRRSTILHAARVYVVSEQKIIKAGTYEGLEEE